MALVWIWMTNYCSSLLWIVCLGGLFGMSRERSSSWQPPINEGLDRLHPSSPCLESWHGYEAATAFVDIGVHASKIESSKEPKFHVSLEDRVSKAAFPRYLGDSLSLYDGCKRRNSTNITRDIITHAHNHSQRSWTSAATRKYVSERSTTLFYFAKRFTSLQAKIWVPTSYPNAHLHNWTATKNSTFGTSLLTIPPCSTVNTILPSKRILQCQTRTKIIRQMRKPAIS